MQFVICEAVDNHILRARFQNRSNNLGGTESHCLEPFPMGHIMLLSLIVGCKSPYWTIHAFRAGMSYLVRIWALSRAGAMI